MLNLLRGLVGLKASAAKVKPPKPVPISLDDLRQRLLDEERPSLWLRSTDQPAFSKLGGLPDLEASFEWPSTPDGKPMAFVAQIDLAQARAEGGPDWLPDIGALYFFWEVDCGRVIYRTDIASGSRASSPGTRVFLERYVRLQVHPSYPSPDWMNVFDRTRHIDEDELVALEHLRPGPGDEGSDHRFCGYPDPIQSGFLALECELRARGESQSRSKLGRDPVAFDTMNDEATAKWRMLLQIDSDPDLDMDWIDGGRIWFFVREDDARIGDFSQVQDAIEFF